MVSLNMNGPYEFTKVVIERVIRPNMIGNYALGYVRDGKTFFIKYVGRSDGRLRSRLLEHLNDKQKYEYFKYSYASSVRDAYEKECRNFHDCGGTRLLDNKNHPDRPDDRNYSCPVCGK